MAEKYKPSSEETSKAEQMMTGEQSEMSTERERKHLIEKLGEMKEGEYEQRCLELLSTMAEKITNPKKEDERWSNLDNAGVDESGKKAKWRIDFQNILPTLKDSMEFLSHQSLSEMAEGGSNDIKFDNEMPLHYRNELIDKGRGDVMISGFRGEYTIAPNESYRYGKRPILIPLEVWNGAIVPRLEGDEKNYETAKMVEVQGQLQVLLREFRSAKKRMGEYQQELAKDGIENPETYSIFKNEE